MTQQSTKLLLVTFLSITAGTPAIAADQPINFQKPDMDLINREIIKATNAARARHGLPALGNSKHLTYAAQLHTNDMVNQNFFDHNNPHDASKRTPEQRIAMSGYKAGATAENIAGSFGIKYEAGASVSFGGPGVIKLNGVEIPPHSPRSLAESLVTQWMNSPGHRANILSQGVTEMGSGVTFYVKKDFNSIIGVKACQVFGSPMNAPAGSAPGVPMQNLGGTITAPQPGNPAPQPGASNPVNQSGFPQGYFMMTTKFAESQDLFLESAPVTLRKRANLTGMSWKAVPAGNGYFFLTSEHLEAKGDVLEGGDGRGVAAMMPKTGVTGTLWKAVPAGGGYFHLTTLFMEKDGKVLEGNVGDASAGASDHFKGGPHMVTGRPTGTMWKFIPVQ